MSHMRQMQQNGTPAQEYMSEPFAKPDIIDYGTHPIKLQVRLTFSCRYATMCLYSALYCWVSFRSPAVMMWSRSIFSSPCVNAGVSTKDAQMITQTIKNWLSHLFAWWPWKRTATTAYVPPSRNGVMGISQEHLWSASGEGSLPQTGARSVAIEQTNDIATPEATMSLRPPSVEHVDIVTQFPTLSDLSSPPQLTQDEQPPENLTLSTAQFGGETTPIPEQQLAFLQYLVRRGLINEGFEEGQVPEQYRRKNTDEII